MDLWLSDRNRLTAMLAACALMSSIEILAPLFQYKMGDCGGRSRT